MKGPQGTLRVPCGLRTVSGRAPHDFGGSILMKNLYGHLAVLKGAVRVPYGSLTGPSRAPGNMHNTGRLPSGSNLKWILPVRVPHGSISKVQSSFKYRGADVRGHIVQCTARDPAGRLEDPGWAPTGHLEDPGRVPAGHLPGATCAPAHRTEHVSLPAGILTGALHFTRPIFSGHLPGAAEYVTTHAVEMKIGRFPYGL